MKSFLILSVIILVVKISSSTKVFSCDQGCQDDSECPGNSHCVAVNQNSECGMCLCKAGYKTHGNDCVPNKSEKNQKGKGHGNGKGGGSGSAETTTSAAASTISAGGDQSTASSGPQTTTVASGASSSSSGAISTTQAGPTTQGPPPTPGPVVCSEYNCAATLPTSDDNPFTVRAAVINETAGCKNKLAVPGRPCNMIGGGTCYGIYCLTVDKGNDYCICDYNRVDRQCAIEKPGKCESATAQLPPNAYKVQNKRYRNKNNLDNGSIYGRHFAGSFDDCVKLCSWSAGSCRSVNYGPIAGQNVCELLSTTVTKGSLLESWMVDAPGWQHVQVVAQ